MHQLEAYDANAEFSLIVSDVFDGTNKLAVVVRFSARTDSLWRNGVSSIMIISTGFDMFRDRGCK